MLHLSANLLAVARANPGPVEAGMHGEAASVVRSCLQLDGKQCNLERATLEEI